MEDSKAAVTSAHSDFPSLLSTLPPRRRSPTPASYRDSCLSLINAWHLVQRERGDGGWGGSSEWVRHSGRDGEKQKKKKKAAWIQEMGGFWQRSPPTRREGWELEDEVSLWPRFQDTEPEEAETHPTWTPSPSHAHPSTSVKTITERRGAPSGDGSTPSSDSLLLQLSSCLQRCPSNLWKSLERELRECWGCLDKLLLWSRLQMDSGSDHLLGWQQRTPRWDDGRASVDNKCRDLGIFRWIPNSIKSRCLFKKRAP